MAGTETKRIIELTEASTVQSGDFIAVDSNARGTKKVSTDTLATSAALTAETNARTGADEQMSVRMDGIEEQTALIQNPTKTVSGSLVSFTDGAEMPAKSVIVNIEPQQSGTGTPSPDNVRPISGWESVSVGVSGKNLLKNTGTSRTFNGITFTVNDDGTVTANGTATANAYIQVGTWTKRGTFILNGCPSGESDVSVYVARGTYSRYDRGDGVEFALPESESYLGVVCIINSGKTVSNLIFRPMIRLASDTDPTYAPYSGHTTTAPLGRTAYGGTLDVVTGVLTVDKGFATFDGSSDETYVAGSYGMAFKTYLPNDFKPTTNSGELAGLVSNQMAEVTQASTWGTVGTCAVIANSTQLYFKLASDLTDISALRTYLASNPVQIVYPLATSQTYTLTPQQIDTLFGNNNVWADSGDVEITYRRDISIVINNLESALNG